MPTCRIRIVNSDFNAEQEIEGEDFTAALAEGLRGALGIGTDELCKGQTFFGAEVSVEVDGEMRKRLMVAMGQSPLA